MRLFHFSEDPDIELFQPRPVQVPSVRPDGQDWLNGPLVWAIGEWHQPLYLFPRDCPRILVWPSDKTTSEDRSVWWGSRTCRMIAHVEWAWLPRLKETRLFRYELAPESFISLDDAGMFVSAEAVAPVARETIEDISRALEECDVELRVMPDLTPLQDVWSTSLHASGIRLRNARHWPRR